MTRPALTVGPLATVTEAARRVHHAGVKRLPVVDVVGRLVGIVSRMDLLTSFLRPDEELRREIVEDVIFGDLFMAPTAVSTWPSRATTTPMALAARPCSQAHTTTA
jgi:CBS domain-containing protein